MLTAILHSDLSAHHTLFSVNMYLYVLVLVHTFVIALRVRIFSCTWFVVNTVCNSQIGLHAYIVSSKEFADDLISTVAKLHD